MKQKFERVKVRIVSVPSQTTWIVTGIADRVDTRITQLMRKYPGSSVNRTEVLYPGTARVTLVLTK